MAHSKLQSGRWHKVTTSEEHTQLLQWGQIKPPRSAVERISARVQKGKYCGPGKYLELTYYQRCPRNCCDDFVREVLPASTVIDEIKNEMRTLADFLKSAKE